MDISQINTALLTVISLLGTLGLGVLLSFNKTLAEVKDALQVKSVDIGSLQTEVRHLTKSVGDLTSLFLELRHV